MSGRAYVLAFKYDALLNVVGGSRLQAPSTGGLPEKDVTCLDAPDYPQTPWDDDI